MSLEMPTAGADSVVCDFVQRRFERESPEADTRQLFRVLRQGVLDGTLPSGLRLPPSRQLAGELVIARNTVEEKVLELQKTKRDLAQAIITADNSLIAGLTRENLELLLS